MSEKWNKYIVLYVHTSKPLHLMTPISDVLYVLSMF